VHALKAEESHSFHIMHDVDFALGKGSIK